jgi:hypothetical protein
MSSHGAVAVDSRGAAMPAGHPAPGSGAAAVAAVKVPKAEGGSGRTVAEVWAERAALSGKPVAVRGTVVKFLPGIMGRNWLHLRDTTGSHDKGDDDLTVTTDATAAVGAVVLVTGTVRVDQDFGAGYRYAVMIADAKVAK